MRKFWLLGLTFLLAAVAWLFWHKRPSVEVAIPSRGPAVQGVYATGTVEASIMLPVAPRVGARMVELKADEGSRVSKGQTLARLEDTDLRHTLDQLRTREAFAKKEFLRKAQLVKDDTASKESYDSAKADWNAAQAATRNAEAQLGYLQLQAPDNGTIIRRDGEIGEFIPVNQPVFWLSVDAPLRISAEVDEEDIHQVQPGQKVLIRADAFPGQVFNGTVLAITPKGDPVARSYRVRIGFADKTPLMIGMTAETNIIIREAQDALLIPATALQKGRVWRVTDGTLTAVPVVTGAKSAETVEIIEGISQEDEIVLHPNAKLKEGGKLRTRRVQMDK